jgi:predicted nucleic acid-binding protein
MFNYYFDTDRDAHADTVTLFEECALGTFMPYTSQYVLDELNATKDENKRDKMLLLIGRYDVVVLDQNVEAIQLDEKYLVAGVIPLRFRMDGVHIAMAAVNDLDVVVSMNFQHIVKRKTRIYTASLNNLNGYRTVEILTPMEILEDEKTKYD